MRLLSILAVLFANIWLYADIPSGLIRTGESLPPNTYELVLIPQYVFTAKAVYLTSELRYQPHEDIGVGFSFGSGQLGYNFGTNATWYILSDLPSQPALALLGGVYFNRMEGENFFVAKLAPTVSRLFKIGRSTVTPYGALQLSPSFALGNGTNQFAMKTSIGTQAAFEILNGLRFWWELGLSIVNSMHEMSFGVSYPFAALGG
ncbi:MAG: hypothetical protein HY537_15915 [Deltaproteobacteria bacterium]|nr:hypothetical protein [Deltaproteobacteria bacterium]